LTQDEQSEPRRKAKAKRATDKAPRSTAERALAHLRSAKKGQREVTDPAERAELLLAEANVLALLELADAIGSDLSIGAGADPAE
jgi:hypothetical protein